MIEQFFQISQNKSTFGREIKAGITTFLTMSYILFVQPAVLSGNLLGNTTGMDFGALITATCLASGIGSLIMALYARLPIGQAPGMGQNFYFVTTLIPAALALGYTNGWQIALGAIFVAGLLFFLLTVSGLSDKLISAISPSMRLAVVVGIGLFILLIGVHNSILFIKDPTTGLHMNPHSLDLLVFFFGMILGLILHWFKIPSYILWSIVGSFILAALLHVFTPERVSFSFPQEIFSMPKSVLPVSFHLDIINSLHWKIIPLIIILLFLNVFDAMGGLIAITEHAGLVKNNQIPRVKQALISNSIGSMIGAVFGMSTVTSYIESVAGVEQGGRTGLMSLVVALLFFLSLIFYPLISTIANYPYIVAPALVLVGIAMIRWGLRLDWKDYTELLPSLITAIAIPVTFSIANGIGLGLISYPIIKLLTGRVKELNFLKIFLCVLFLIYFLLQAFEFYA